jgi:acetate kinase
MSRTPLGHDVLTLNAGSTSLKAFLLRADGGTVEYDGLDDAFAGPPPDAVLHRVVHGGSRPAPALVDDAALDELRALVELAPLHQAPALDAIDSARVAWPDAPHVACFDTSFHRTIAEPVSTYALPLEYRSTLRVYGFHGLSHAWASTRVRQLAPDARRVLVAHLGGGASLCAVLDGRSVDTTMGFTPLDGLVMGSRSGHVDPGALLWLAKHSDEDLDDLLETRSGLQGLAGTSDLREVLRRRGEGEPDATLAFEVYLHRLVTHVGAMVAAMQGLDALVFTGGAGEGSRPVREELCSRLAWLGVRTSDDDSCAPRELTAGDARTRTFVVHSREDLQMLAEARPVLGW